MRNLVVRTLICSGAITATPVGNNGRKVWDNDDSFAWQVNLKRNIKKITNDIIENSYIKDGSEHVLVAAGELDKLLEDLFNYSTFDLKLPWTDFFDHCSKISSSVQMPFTDYKRCRVLLQKHLELYDRIFPLISQEQLDILRRTRVRPSYISAISIDEFKRMETLLFIIYGTAIFQLADRNSDGKIDIMHGYNQAEGYEMLRELARMYDTSFEDVREVFSSCNGEGKLESIMLAMTKLEWNHIRAAIDEQNGQETDVSPVRHGVIVKPKPRDYKPTAFRDVYEESPPVVKPVQKPKYMTYNDRFADRQFSTSQLYDKYGSSASIDGCEDIRARNIDPVEKQRRILCWLRKVRGT